MADSFWLRAIQDFDFCEENLAQHICKNSGWLYQMLDLVTDLSPRFRMPYATGGMALDIIVGDIAGATKFYDKAVRHYPKDWPILARAAYHFLFEDKNNAKAARLMQQAAANGAPVWYYALAARTFQKGGETEVAQKMLEQLLQDPTLPPQLIERIKANIKN